MNNAQRVAVLAGCFLCAGILHFGMCRWTWTEFAPTCAPSSALSGLDRPLVIEDPNLARRLSFQDNLLGAAYWCEYRPQIARPAMLIAGVVVPLMFVTVGVVAALGIKM